MLHPEVERLISSARLARYRELAGGDDTTALQLYAWNSSLCAAVLSASMWVEVGLRNAFDVQLSEYRLRTLHDADWTDTDLPWFRPWFKPEVTKALQRARRVAGRGVHRGAQSRGKIIAELSFGFWCQLLAKAYEPSLWTQALRHAFPAGLARPTVKAEIDELRRLRNRAAHHEPILERDISVDWARFEKVLDWLSPAFLDEAAKHCTLPDIARRRPG